MENTKVKLGGLWTHTTREGGRKYLSGTVWKDNLAAAVALLEGGGRLLVLSNTKRPGKKDPDCELFIVPASAPGASGEPSSGSATKSAAGRGATRR